MIQTVPGHLLWREEIESETNAYVRAKMACFADLRETYVERWFPVVGEVAVPAWFVELTATERDVLIEERWRQTHRRPSLQLSAFDTLVERLERLVRSAQTQSAIGAAFLRLGSRAPLDSPQLRAASLQVDGGVEALDVLLDSQRVFEDLCLAQECDYLPAVVVRPWLEVPLRIELRARYQDGAFTEVRPRYGTGSPAPDALSALERRLAVVAAHFGSRHLITDWIVGGEAWLVDVDLPAGNRVPD